MSGVIYVLTGTTPGMDQGVGIVTKMFAASDDLQKVETRRSELEAHAKELGKYQRFEGSVYSNFTITEVPAL